MVILLKLIPQEVGGHIYVIVIIVLVVYLLYWWVYRLVTMLPVAEVLEPISLFVDLHWHWSPLHFDLLDVSFRNRVHFVVPYLKIVFVLHCWLAGFLKSSCFFCHLPRGAYLMSEIELSSEGAALASDQPREPQLCF